MPQSRFERLMFALLTVIITVPCFVFYCASCEQGGFTVDVIAKSWVDIPIELVLAYLSAIFVGSPLAAKWALKAVNPAENKPIIVQTAIVCATVCIMCPLMSFWATILYDGIIAVGINGGSITYFLTNFIPFWLQKVVLNFPFAFFTQLFFIQPFVRTLFKFFFRRKQINVI